MTTLPKNILISHALTHGIGTKMSSFYSEKGILEVEGQFSFLLVEQLSLVDFF